MVIKKIKSNKKSIFVLAGDLTGFSFAYDKGNTNIIDEYIKRLYYFISGIIKISKGNLVKFTGDGYLAVWELTDDNDKNKLNAELLIHGASFITRFLRITKLGLKLENKLVLRQGITIEPNSIKLNMESSNGTQLDYIGNMINYAFRIQCLANSYPYICIHKHFLAYLEIPNFVKLEITKKDEQSINNIFKNVQVDKNDIYEYRKLEEDRIDYLIVQTQKAIEKEHYPLSDQYKSQVVFAEFKVEYPKLIEKHDSNWEKKINKFLKTGPKWLDECYYFYWVYIKQLEILLYNLNHDNNTKGK